MANTRPMKNSKPFAVRGAVPLRFKPLGRFIDILLEKMMGLDGLNKLYQQSIPAESSQQFVDQLLEQHQVEIQVGDLDWSRIPASGGAIVIANHPCGGIDGIVMVSLLKKIRPDVKIMANHLLQCIPEMRDLFISVDPFAGEGAVQSNIRPLREAIRWVRQGGLLMVFPAGEVSHYQSRYRKITDPQWNESIAHIIRLTRVPVVPVYLSGQNCLLFQAAGFIHPRLRTLMLARELLNKQGHRIRICVGRAVDYRKVASLNASALIDYLRLQTYALGDQLVSESVSAPQRQMEQPIIPAIDSKLLLAEVNALAPGQLLVTAGAMRVYVATAAQIPYLLQEIGRLRETTFRMTHEGTGKACDVDLYDEYYLHLFAWHEQAGEVVGAYRLGLSEEIVPRFGIKGLYTYSLFHYSEELMHELSPSIELGRSFVREEYQRSYLPLLLLLKGVFTYAAKHPEYRYLFGPVSISDSYNTLSRKLLITFLEENTFLPNLARLVKPRYPFQSMNEIDRRSSLMTTTDIHMISELISASQEDSKNMPVMLKQYLKLGARLLGFSIDKEFNNVVDGLIMLDMPRIDIRTLNKYMGAELAAAYCSYHGDISPDKRQSEC
ncbi:lysophospholipid acyltransferase family protein [Mariprofundus erugo]|nr:lysophospholipid acyltransferase family protein [Mariprofundus erugo]